MEILFIFIAVVAFWLFLFSGMAPANRTFSVHIQYNNGTTIVKQWVTVKASDEDNAAFRVMRNARQFDYAAGEVSIIEIKEYQQ